MNEAPATLALPSAPSSALRAAQRSTPLGRSAASNPAGSPSVAGAAAAAAAAARPRAPLRIAFAGGGTGGHLYPAIAMARAVEALAPGSATLFLGSDRPLERQILAPTGYRHEAQPAAPWRGLRRPGAALRFTTQTLAGLRTAHRLLADFRPDVVVGLGGYPSLGPCLAARLLGAPVVLFEPNAAPGRANLLLARLAREAYVHWEETRLACPLVRSGTPLDGRALPAAELSRAEARRRLGLPAATPVILVMGGSQGSQAINAWVRQGLSALAGPEEVAFLHLAGSPEAAAELEEAYGRAGCARAVHAFLPEVGLAYRAADLAVVRGGGATLAELLAAGTPGVVVPLPSSAGDHQRLNARAFAAAGAGTTIEERDLTVGEFRRVMDLARDEEQLAALGARARGAGRPDAARRAALRLIEIASGATDPGVPPAA